MVAVLVGTTVGCAWTKLTKESSVTRGKHGHLLAFHLCALVCQEDRGHHLPALQLIPNSFFLYSAFLQLAMFGLWTFTLKRQSLCLVPRCTPFPSPSVGASSTTRPVPAAAPRWRRRLLRRRRGWNPWPRRVSRHELRKSSYMDQTSRF